MKVSGKGIPNVNIQLYSLPDTLKVKGTSSDTTGTFSISRLSSGPYLLSISAIGFKNVSRSIEIKDSDIEDLKIQTETEILTLQEIRIPAHQKQVEIRGDTTIYNSDSHKIRPDATAGDLLLRLPGILKVNGILQAQGKEVTKILVDGKEFFGKNPSTALENLPAEIVKEIEIYDQYSEQARFTGFKDENPDRVINLVTRMGMKEGRFGKTTTSLGTKKRYMGGVNFNSFDDPQRFSIVGISNNLNQSQLSNEELISGSRSGNSGNNHFGGTIMGGYGNRGVSTNHSISGNYNNHWGDKWQINGDLHLDLTERVTNQDLERNYLTGSFEDYTYNENSENEATGNRNRINMKLEYQIDQKKSLMISPMIQFNKRDRTRTMIGKTLSPGNELVNQVMNEQTTDNTGYYISNRFLYRQRFEKKGRTFSTNINARINPQDYDQKQIAESMYYDIKKSDVINDQQLDDNSFNKFFSADLSFTEPISKKSRMMISYQPSYEIDDSDRKIYKNVNNGLNFTSLDSSLTNQYENITSEHRVTGSYNYGWKKFNLSLQMAYKYILLKGNQKFPQSVETSNNWQALLPRVRFSYRIPNSGHLSLSYVTHTRQPHSRQLQDVIDNSNPLHLSGGNPNLNQQYSHRISIIFRDSGSNNTTFTTMHLDYNITENYLGRASLVAKKDTLLQGDIVLGRGARFTRTENMDNMYAVRANVTYGTPIDFIQSNLNLNASTSYREEPYLIDKKQYTATNISITSGFLVNSNFDEHIDFRFAYNTSYQWRESKRNESQNNEYYSGRVMAQFNIMPWKGLVLISDFNLSHYFGLGKEYRNTPIAWNSAIGYKFLDQKAAEIRLSLYDILAKNDSIDRRLANDYIEDMRMNVVSSFFLLTFRYNFKNFSGDKQLTIPQFRQN